MLPAASRVASSEEGNLIAHDDENRADAGSPARFKFPYHKGKSSLFDFVPVRWMALLISDADCLFPLQADITWSKGGLGLRVERQSDIRSALDVALKAARLLDLEVIIIIAALAPTAFVPEANA